MKHVECRPPVGVTISRTDEKYLDLWAFCVSCGWLNMGLRLHTGVLWLAEGKLLPLN